MNVPDFYHFAWFLHLTAWKIIHAVDISEHEKKKLLICQTKSAYEILGARHIQIWASVVQLYRIFERILCTDNINKNNVLTWNKQNIWMRLRTGVSVKHCQIHILFIFLINILLLSLYCSPYHFLNPIYFLYDSFITFCPHKWSLESDTTINSQFIQGVGKYTKPKCYILSVTIYHQ